MILHFYHRTDMTGKNKFYFVCFILYFCIFIFYIIELSYFISPFGFVCYRSVDVDRI